MDATAGYVIDTLFAIFSFVLIIFMLPGFAMFEAGLVRTKNVSTVLLVNVMIYSVASMAFVSKVVNIMSGGVSERTKTIPLAFFTVIAAALIYPVVVNWTWGTHTLSILDISAMHDLAGITVIHSTGAWALLAAILIVGPKKGRYTKEGKVRVVPASNIPLVTLGALILWIGWFGFNGGSVGSIASKEAADTFALTVMNTNTAGLAGAIVAGIIMYMRYKKFDITMILNGTLGGLVAITAGADVMDIYSPIVIGGIGAVLVVFAVPFFDKLKIDDPVGALSVHLINGIWGTLAVGIFVDGVSFIEQLKGVAVVAVFAFRASYIALYAINKLVPLRADDEKQTEGLDVSECGLEAYPEFKRAY